MLFKTTFLAGLATLVAADYASILSTLNTVSTDTAKLNTDLTAYNGNLIFAVPVLGDNVNLNKDLINGTSVAKASDPLSASDAINLVAPVQSLATQVNVTLTNLINKYPTFKAGNLAGIVLGTLTVTRGNSQDYSNAIISKVPADLQSTAQNIAAPIDAAFVEAIAVYQQS